MEHRVLPALHRVLLHDPLVTLLPLHQLLDHGTVLLIDGGLVGVGASHRLRLDVVTSILARARDLRQLDVAAAAMSFIIVRSYFSLDVVVGKHGVVEDDPTLWSVTLSLIFVVIIDTVDVYDSLIVLPRVSLDLDDARVAAAIVNVHCAIGAVSE